MKFGIYTLASGQLPNGFKMFLFAEQEDGGYFLIEFNNTNIGELNFKSE